ncbi:RHS repeat domain-containing protein [Treponema sp. OMZ 906]|uniref:RHS repeat domain-containing protein n=1 Tax=Treponema sp. OMZ 906 TaxID=2563662 RepID=UPI0020A408A6|nr:RHS repeat-associated core domain-containing protein [Treponema sp. OMZ 906]
MQVRFLKRPSGKTPREQNSSGKKIGAESAVLHFVFFIVIVNKMQQSAKKARNKNNKSSLPEVFPLTAILAGSGKTKPFEKRRSRYKETAENKAEAYRVYVEHLFSACDAVDARIFSKGDGNMTRKVSTTNLPGARGNAYPKAELDYSLDYEYDPAYAHRLVHAGNRYYRYDVNGNITAEKDGPFTEDDEFVFTYSYDPDTDVYGTDYGFGLDAPKETEESHPENLFAYRRNYTWNEKNLLTKSSDRSYTVHYRYGEDGQRALKYTEEGRSETLYFNNFYTIHIPVQDKNNPQGLRVHKHIFVGNSRLVTAMTHTDNNGDNAEQREKRYYYHSDHLGSAQFVTDWRGRQYEHIEYTPYGELWIEEVAAGLDKLPFRFTGKEMDEETGLYYYGARYLDPKYSRWLSGDPALNDYIPKAPIDDEAKKHNENLPGMGGVFNVVNLHLYHYAGNNPIKYEDPDGKDIISFFKGWVNYNLNNTIFSRYGSQYAYNPQFEMANEVLANIDQMMQNGYSVYVQTLKFTSEHSGTATLFLLTIGQPGLAAITSTIGLAADSLLVIDNFANGNIVEGSKGIAVIGLSMLANNGVKKGFEKLGSLVGISVGKNGLYYMKGRRGALKTIDGIRKQLYKDLVEGYFGQAIAPEVASQMVDTVMKEILKTEKVEE